MAIPQLNFNRSTVIDPTRGALQGITSARNTLTDTMGQWARDEELARQNARQKVLDDRATTTYNQQQQELTDRQKFGQAMLGDTEMRYADANAPGSEIMSRMKNVELTPEELALSNKGQTTPAIAAKLKAQMEFGQQFDNTGVRETEWEKAQRLAKELKVGGSAGVQERLYGIKAADVAARTKKEADAKAAKNELIKKYDEQSDKLDDLLVVKKGKYGSSGTDSTSKSTSSKNLWTPDALKEVQGIANTLTPFGYESASDGKPSTDTKLAMDVINYGQPELSPAEMKHVLAIMGGSGDESYFSGEVLTKYGKEVPREELAQYGKDLVDSIVAKRKNSSGGTGATGGFYDKEDTSEAVKMKKAKLASLKKQIDAIGGTNYDAPTTTPEERSMEKMNSLAQKLWSDTPATGEKVSKSTSKTGGTTSTKIPGKIGAAMSSSTDGDVARLSLLPEFANEYEDLTKPQQARVDRVLGSDASQKVYDDIKVNTSTAPILPKKKEEYRKPILNAVGNVIGYEKTTAEKDQALIKEYPMQYRALKRQYPELSESRLIERLRSLNN